MKYINRIIRRKIMEITICCILVISSVPLWNLWQNDNIAYAKTYENTSYAYVTVSRYQKYEMVPMKDQEALRYLYPMKVTLTKTLISDTHYTLVIRVSKKSNIDLSSIKVSINNQIYFLQDRFYKEDASYNYYLIEEGVLKEPEKDYSLNIWLDENATTEKQKKNFLYDIINLELNNDLPTI
ncbi:TPA: hypothetical protein IAB29_04730 [Candidatus Ventrenecus stercoripullorum]|nr:hypothetical protein [Candidatus Ventrenecus stercoripullorum]